MPHTCHAHGCETRVPPKMFMCRRHWSALPSAIRAAIWREYRPGQERDKNPSASYLAVQQWAVAHSAFKPQDEAAAAAAGNYILRAVVFRTLAMTAGQRDPLRGLVPAGVEIPDVTIEQARALAGAS